MFCADFQPREAFRKSVLGALAHKLNQFNLGSQLATSAPRRDEGTQRAYLNCSAWVYQAACFLWFRLLTPCSTLLQLRKS